MPAPGSDVQDTSLWDFASLNSLKPQLQSNRLAPAEALKKESQKPMRSSREEGWAHFPSVSQPASGSVPAEASNPMQVPNATSAQPQGERCHNLDQGLLTLEISGRAEANFLLTSGLIRTTEEVLLVSCEA